MVFNKEKMGAKIRQARKENGLTQEKLAKKLNFNSRTINLMENGKCGLTIETLINLCDVLGVTPNYILSYKSNENSIINEIQDFTPAQLEVVKELLVSLKKFSNLNNI